MPEADHDVPEDPVAEYQAIERALLETSRGRWFLSEHSRRSRRMESAALEAALTSLKNAVRNPPALLGRLKTDMGCALAEVATVRDALLARPAGNGAGGGTPAAIIRAAEELHEMAWALQSKDVDAETCTALGKSAASIFALAAAQAQESERARRFAAALDELATYLASAIRSIDMELAQTPAGTSPEPSAEIVPILATAWG